MKLLEDDWKSFLRLLPVWERLSVPARRAFLQLKTSQNASPSLFGADLPLLLEQGFLERHPGGGHVTVHESARLFSRAIRAMSRHPVLHNPSARACEA